MQSRIVFGFLLMTFVSCASHRSEILTPEQEANYLKQAQSATQSMASQLKQHLVSAIKSGGPTSAITVCNAIAPALAQQVSEQHKLSIHRVSLKTRNLQNQPDVFEKKVLEQWQADPKRIPADGIGQVEQQENQQVFRYMKPIRIEAACLQCHGPTENIKPEVKEILKQYYPDDRATGYQEGDLRGAFSVVIPVQ